MGQTSHMESIRLWELYGVADPHGVAARYRNPYSALLIGYVETAAARLRELLPFSACRIVLGGSFGYDAALAGNYDLDLRILLRAPAEKEIKTVSEHIKSEIPFDRIIVARESGETIYHHVKYVNVPGIPVPVKLSLNIQSEENYFGVAELARCLPEIVRDRYVAARGRAQELGNKTDSAAIKQHWLDMVQWLERHGIRSARPGDMPNLLKQAEPLFPLFLKKAMEE